MLECYHQLKQKLSLEGYDKALKFVDELPTQSHKQMLLKTNLYCYLTIHCEYQNSRSLTILQQCLAHTECTKGIRALTRYHLCQLFFSCDVQTCGRQCEEVIAQFIGTYHMLQSGAERTAEEEEELWLLQYAICAEVREERSKVKVIQKLVKVCQKSGIEAASLSMQVTQGPGQLKIKKEPNEQ